ncbi:MAG: hypothetical protein MJZ68_01355 [archaeon]|nr:hypothetical protein [archaeon]
MAIVSRSKNGKKIKLLFVDELNNESSQLAEYFTRQLYPDLYDVYSAGPKHDIIDCDLLSVMYCRGDDLRNMISKDFDNMEHLPKDGDYDFIIWTEKGIYDRIAHKSPWQNKQCLVDFGCREKFNATDDAELAECFQDMADKIMMWVKENLKDPENLKNLVSQ